MPLRFKTMVQASGAAMMIYGEPKAIGNAMLLAHQRLCRVSGWNGGDFYVGVKPMARTGDDRKFIVSWFKEAI